MLNRQSNILILGLILSAVTLGLGYAYIYYLQTGLDDLVDLCRQNTSAGSFGGRLLCDPDEFTYPYPTNGIQGAIVSFDRRINNAGEITWGAAIAVFVLFSLPWFWYFLLKRIRELSNALMGRKE